MNHDVEKMKKMAEKLVPGMLGITCFEQGWGFMHLGESVIGMELLKNRGKVFGHGFGPHAESRIRLDLAVPLKRFSAVAGPCENSATVRSRERMAPMRFTVEADGRSLVESPLLPFESAFSSGVPSFYENTKNMRFFKIPP